ncbi:MAG: glycosyltransferase family 2 protein [Phycisphaerae bacterium]|nr:glycosyltransferase family 2 protein [Phycisphaerae bacterium]
MMSETIDDRQFSISVIIPTYNAAGYIGRAIDSVLAQTYRPDEVIVVDDGSTDNTAEVIQSYGASVRYIYQNNAGPGAARNRGIKAAAGRWLAFLDSDDAWLAHKLQCQVDLLKRNPELMWVGANFIFHHEESQSEYLALELEEAKTFLSDREFVENYIDMILNMLIWTPSVLMVHRDVFQVVGGYVEGLYFSEDFELCLRIACHWPKFGYNAEPLMIYTKYRSDGLTNSQTTMAKNLYVLQVFDIHLAHTRQYGQYDSFCRFVVWDLHRIIYDMFYYKRYDYIRHILSRYCGILPMSTKAIMVFLIAFPLVNMLCQKKTFKLFSWQFVLDFRFAERLRHLLKVGK